MKTIVPTLMKTRLAAALCAAILAGSAGLVSAQNTNPTNTFDSGSSTASFVQWWGTATMSWDGTRDAASDPFSGSVQYVAPFVGNAGEQFMTHFTIANRWGWDDGYVLDATTYTNMSFDIKVDPSSPLTPGGNYGNLEVGFTSLGWGTYAVQTYTIPASATSWTHVDMPLNGTMPNIDKVVGYYFKMWSNGAHTNTLTFNLDNVMYTKPTAPVIIPPPTTDLSAAVSGLNLITTAAGGANARQSIRPLNSSYQWVGAPNPVSFKVTIKDYPDDPNTQFQTHIHLAPSADIPWGPGDTSVDWNATNLVFVQIQNNPNGAGQAQFMFKTNVYTENRWAGQIFGSNTLAVLNSATVVGTWTVTFNQDTNITMIAPDGSTTNFVMQPDAAAYFNSPVYCWIGAQANNGGNVGQRSVLSRVEITGFPSDNVDDTFQGSSLDSGTWATVAGDPVGVIVVSTNTAYWLNWTVPDSGFFPEYSTSVGPSSTWSDLTGGITLYNAKKHIQIPTGLTSGNAFFRLVKRPFSKLQVLMPGETAAPGTPTGKTGTPNAQTAGVPFNVIVNAVDSSWHVITSVTDTVNITSTDGTATLPGDAALVAGTGTFIVTFNSSGTWTVTATDVTDGTKTPDTGSSTLVP